MEQLYGKSMRCPSVGPRSKTILKRSKLFCTSTHCLGVVQIVWDWYKLFWKCPNRFGQVQKRLFTIEFCFLAVTGTLVENPLKQNGFRNIPVKKTVHKMDGGQQRSDFNCYWTSSLFSIWSSNESKYFFPLLIIFRKSLSLTILLKNLIDFSMQQ